jgi:hypothetical protein
MAIKSAKVQMNSILGRIKNKVKEAQSKSLLTDLGNFAANIVVERTRSGKGVPKMFGRISQLAKLKSRTIQKRSVFRGLDSTTTPEKSNLTMTGKMLRSIRAIVREGRIEISPTQARNIQVAKYAHEGSKYRKPRIFMNLSKTEMDLVTKKYRQMFGVLLKK